MTNTIDNSKKQCYILYGIRRLILSTKRTHAPPLKETSISLPGLLGTMHGFPPEILNAIIVGILDKLLGAFIVVDNKWQLIYVNPRAENFFNKKKDELIGKNIWRIIPEAKKTDLYHAFHLAMENMVPVTSEEYYSPTDSWYEIRAFRTPLGLAIYYEQITSRKKSEDELLHYSERLELAQKAGNIGSFEWDLETDKAVWFADIESLYGLESGGLGDTFTTLFERIHHKDRKRVERLFNKSIKTGENINTEYRIIWPDRTVHWIAVKATVLSNTRKKAQRIIGVNMNFTHRKKAEEALYQLAAIFDSSDDAIMSKTIDGIITNWNKGAEKLFGYTAKEMIGMPVTTLVPADRLIEEAEIIEVVKIGESIDHYDTIRKAKDGSLVDVSISISPIRDTKGKIIGAASISRDITAYKELERRKDDFIGMASHELKTPITSLRVFNQLLLKMFEGKKDDKAIYYLHKMNDQLLRLSTLIGDLLDISKIQAGKLELRKERFDMNELIKETIENFQGISENHKLVMKGKIKSLVYGDKDRLGQVLINLLTNAIKYSPNAKKVVIHAKEEKNVLNIGVQDFGIGIDKDHQDKIFGRFFRVEGASEKTFPGLGVGLYISLEIAKRHGGSISVESKRGEGATFYLHLPLR